MQAVHVGNQRHQRGAGGSALFGSKHSQIISTDDSRRVLRQQAFGMQINIATAGVGQVANRQVRGRCADLVGSEHDVVGIPRTQRAGGDNVERAIGRNADRTVKGLRQGYRQRRLVQQFDGARASQAQRIGQRNLALQPDAGLGQHREFAGRDQAGDDLDCHVVQERSRPLGIDRRQRGLGDETGGRRQQHRLVGSTGRQRGAVHGDIAAILAGGQHQVTCERGQRGVAVGADAAVVGRVGASQHAHGAGQNRAAERHIAPRSQRCAGQCGTTGSRLHDAAQHQFLAGVKRNRGVTLGRSLRAAEQHRVVQIQSRAGVQVDHIALEDGGDLANCRHTTDAETGGFATEADFGSGVDIDAVERTELATERDIAASVNHHGARRDRVTGTRSTTGLGGVDDVGYQLGLGCIDRTLFPQRDGLHLLDLDHLDAGLPDRPVVVHVLRLR